MKPTACPKHQLPLMITQQLDPESDRLVMEHLNNCPSCQAELESISAEKAMWNQARQVLADVATDDDSRLIAADTVNCSIETLLGTPDFKPTSAKSVLEVLDPPTHPEMLGQIDEFIIEEEIGKGGMGIVFRGFDQSLNRPVAIKVMAPHLGSNDVARQRFEREAKAAAAVVHPNVVNIYRVSTSNKERPYIAMALADGLSLQEYVSRHGPLDVKDVIRIGIQIASGLAEAHKQGLIHRDIKPANVLFEKDVSRILITDFGLARAADDVMMTHSGCLAGTPSYMSPEQVTGEKLDRRSDLFSLGSLLYFISTGRPPFQGESPFAVINQVARDVPKSPRNINIDIPHVLDRIILRLLEKDPMDRIQSAFELEDLLTKILAHLQEPGQHKVPSVKATTSERRQIARRMSWVTASMIGAVLLIVAAYMGGFFDASSTSPLDRDHASSATQPYKKNPHQENQSSAGPLRPQQDTDEANQNQENDAENPEAERLAKFIERSLDGLKSSCRLQANLRLDEIQRFLELEDSEILKAKVLIKGIVDKSFRRSEERVTQRLSGIWQDIRDSNARTYSVNSEVFWLAPDEIEGEELPKVAEVKICADLIRNHMIIRIMGGRTVLQLSQRSTRIEQMDFWDSALKNIPAEQIERFKDFESARNQQCTISGIVAIYAHELNLDPDQCSKFEALVQDKISGSRGNLKSIHDQFTDNNEILTLEPDFLTNAQLAKWQLLKKTERKPYWIGN